ncbi:MAG: cyclic nucleotide-binding domain-containing protein [Deltaproteobacteria bacterium]|nr:cyclic nucleotide-binding domain-containing protein [Deltaproteobacteria bacterium]MBF0524941.1 cyclic nucleotide-binding domain-containing protein [Deltaproteobacteria bacterium]
MSKTTFTTKAYPKGLVIFKENSRGDAAFIVKLGAVEISKLILGRKVVLGVFREGQVFGEMALINTVKRTATATALEYTELIHITKDQLMVALGRSPKIVESLVVALVNRLIHTTEILSGIAGRDFLMGAAMILDLMSSLLRQCGQEDIIPHGLAREGIKKIMNVPGSRVDSLFTKLRDINLIRLVPVDGRLGLQLVNYLKFVNRVEELMERLEETGEDLFPENAFIDLTEMAGMMNTSERDVLNQLAAGQIPERHIYFDREGISAWFDKQGFNDKAMLDQFSGEWENLLDDVTDIPSQPVEAEGRKSKAMPKRMPKVSLYDLSRLKPDGIKKIFNHIGMYNLSLALKVMPPEHQEAILSSIPQQAAQLIRDEMAQLPDATEEKLQSIEQEIVVCLQEFLFRSED